LNSGSRGLSLALAGYQDKLPILLRTTTQKMAALQEVSEQTWGIVYTVMLRNAKIASKTKQPYQQAAELERRCLHRTAITSIEYLNIVQNLTRDKVQGIGSQVLDQCYAEALLQGNYTEAEVAGLLEALRPTGREHRADFKVLARAFARIGNAHYRKGMASEVEADKQEILSEAIEAYNKSLTEHRTDDVWTKLKKAQSEKKKAAEKAYVDPAKAAEEKEAGNVFFKEGQWVEAMRKYSEAIKRDPKGPDTHIFHSNRATCFIRMNEMDEAIKDLDACIALNPKYVKAHLNKAHIKFTQKEYQKVLPIYEDVLAIEDVDEESKKKAMDGRTRTIQAIQAMQSEGADEEQLQRAQADPEIQQILGDPMVQQVLRDFKENPQHAQKALKDPNMSAKLNKLAAAGVIRFG